MREREQVEYSDQVGTATVAAARKRHRGSISISRVGTVRTVMTSPLLPVIDGSLIFFSHFYVWAIDEFISFVNLYHITSDRAAPRPQ